MNHLGRTRWLKLHLCDGAVLAAIDGVGATAGTHEGGVGVVLVQEAQENDGEGIGDDQKEDTCGKEKPPTLVHTKEDTVHAMYHGWEIKDEGQPVTMTIVKTTARCRGGICDEGAQSQPACMRPSDCLGAQPLESDPGELSQALDAFFMNCR